MAWHEIRDPIYGFIKFNELEKEIISDPFFQRLRRIKQLSLTEMVYPSGVHTRFEHSLGVMYLASRFFDAIVNDDKNLELLETSGYEESELKRERKVIRLAALLHDIGHGPFSHLSEGIFPANPNTGNQYRHEDYSDAIIRGPIRAILESSVNNKSNITADEVAALITGDIRTLKDRIIWKELISSQLDADRCDYLLRDSYHTGVSYGLYDINRLVYAIAMGRTPPDEGDNITLSIKKESWQVAESLILARYQFYSQVSYHKIIRSYSLMLEKALDNQYPDKLPLPNESGLEKFLKIDDYSVFTKMNDCDDYWSRSIIERRHLKCIFDELNSDNINRMKEETKTRLEEKDIRVYEDPETGKKWYKSSKDGGQEKDIMIIDRDNRVKPILNYSVLLQKIIETPSPIRLYVRNEDLKNANAVLGRE